MAIASYDPSGYLAMFRVEGNGVGYYSKVNFEQGQVPARPTGQGQGFMNDGGFYFQQPDQTLNSNDPVDTPAPIPPVPATVDSQNLVVFFAKDTTAWRQTRRSVMMGIPRGGMWETTCSGGSPCSMKPDAPSLGAAAMPDNSAFLVAYATPTGQIEVDAWWIPTVEGESPPGRAIATINPQAGAGTWDGNVSLALRTEGNTDSTQQPFGYYLALRIGNAIWVGSGRMTQVDPNRSYPYPLVPRWTMITPAGGLSANSTANIHLAPDANLWLAYLDSTGQTQLYQLTGTPEKLQAVAKGSPLPSGIKPTRVPSFAYRFGSPAVSTPIPGNQDLKKITVPVFRNIFYSTGDQRSEYGPAGFINAYGTAIRDPLPPIQGATQMLLGIIDGPPPIPQENLQSAAAGGQDVGAHTELGHTVFGSKVASGSDSSFTVKGGVAFKADVGGGEVPSFAMETEAKLGAGQTSTEQVEKTMLTSYTSVGGPIRNPNTGQWEIVGNGVAYALGSLWSGYHYYFVDSGGTQIPGSAVRDEVFATSPTVTTFPFNFNPKSKSGIIPGELMTYVLRQSDIDQLARNSAYQFQNGASFIDFAWAEGGTFSEEAEILKKTTDKSEIDFDLSLLIGASQSGETQKWRVVAGAYVNIESESTVSESNQTTLATEVDPPPAPERPGVYTRYGYKVFYLKGDNAYAKELVDLLRSNPTPANRDLLVKLVDKPDDPSSYPAGAPWKITYAIVGAADGGDFFQIPPGGGSARGFAASQTQLASLSFDPQQSQPMGLRPGTPLPIPPSLAAKGVDSASKIGLLHQALLQMNTPARVMPSRPASASQQQMRMLSTQLTPNERASVIQYVQQAQKATLDDFQRRHPQWKPRHFPVPGPVPPGVVPQHLLTPPAAKKPTVMVLGAVAPGLLRAKPVPSAKKQ